MLSIQSGDDRMLTNRLPFRMKLLLGFFSAAILLVLPLRVYQYLTIIESGTGFYENSDVTVVLMYVLLAVFCAAFILPSYFRRGHIRFRTSAAKRPVLGVLCLAVAVTLVVDAVVQAGNYTQLLGSAQQGYYDVTNNGAATDGIMKSGAMPMRLEAIFAVFAAVFFTVFGIGSIRGKTGGSEYRLLAITPLLWAIARILHRFMRTISFTRVSDLLFELLMLVFLMLFFMAFAQLLSRVNCKGVDWKLTAYGLSAALFCLLCFVPRMAMVLMGKGDMLADLSPPEYCDLAIGVFIPALLISRVSTSLRDQTPVDAGGSDVS